MFAPVTRMYKCEDAMMDVCGEAWTHFGRSLSSPHVDVFGTGNYKRIRAVE
jgi:hypothetical protein